MQKLIRAVEQRLLEGRDARRRLPGGGRLQIERLLPFLLVHRRRAAVRDQATEKLLAHASSALVVDETSDVSELVRMIVDRGTESFGSFLLLELWAGPVPEPAETPRLILYGPKRAALIPLVNAFQDEFRGIEIAGRRVAVEVHRGLHARTTRPCARARR